MTLVAPAAPIAILGQVTDSVLGSISHVQNQVVTSIGDVVGSIVSSNVGYGAPVTSPIDGVSADVSAAFAEQALNIAEAFWDEALAAAKEAGADVGYENIEFGASLQYYNGRGCWNTNFDGKEMKPIVAGLCEQPYNLPPVISGGYPVFIHRGPTSGHGSGSNLADIPYLGTSSSSGYMYQTSKYPKLSAHLYDVNSTSFDACGTCCLHPLHAASA